MTRYNADSNADSNVYPTVNSAYMRSRFTVGLLSLIFGISVGVLLSGCEPEEDQYQDELISCQAYPSCNPDEIEVESCPEGEDSCREAAVCGYTILCAPAPMACTAAPQCRVGMIEVESCEEVDETCEEQSLCGVTIFCAEDVLVSCQAYPSCDPDEVEVDSCEEDDDSCYEVSTCGYTILCAAADAD